MVERTQIDHALSKWRKEGGALGMTRRELDHYEEAFEYAERNAAQKAMA